MKLLLACCLLSVCTAAESASLWVSSPARLYEHNNLRENTLDKCSPQTMVAQKMLKELVSISPDVQPWGSDTVLDEKDPTPRLVLTILAGNTTGGGGWSGSKMLMIRAELQRPGRATLTLVKSRAGKGGVFGAVKGTCDILQELSEALAEDVTAWLKKSGIPAPTKEAAVASESL